ncbi:hypothetical protein [Plantactinospora sp. GCM10030261]|uniref:hypothetical protein n=1 Tax=Plantactinospora sp. GCM10030261 TaxID=3273420 RepID=UPI003619D7DC
MGAAGIWTLLLVGGGVALALVGLAVLADRPRDDDGPDPESAHAEAAELTAHAARMHDDARRAAANSVEAAERLAAAQRARDEAWDAQERAEQAYERAFQEVLDGRNTEKPVIDGVPEDPEREREVSRAALSAYRRGDISVRELREVWRLTGDWDPAQEEREWAADRLQRERSAARRAYERAAAELHRTAEVARVAEVAANALVAEAAAAAVEAQQVQDVLVADRRRAGRRWRVRR